MYNMFMMNERMTVRTYYHQIFSFIIFSIFINMMYSKNIFIFIISTYFALFNKSSSFKSISNTRKINVIFWVSLIISSAFYRTKSIIFRRRSQKVITAIFTLKFLRSFSFLRSMITYPRTIFCFITSRRNMCKLIPTYATIRFYLLSTSKLIFTCPRTIFKSFESINGHVALFSATKTIQKFTSARLSHAAP